MFCCCGRFLFAAGGRLLFAVGAASRVFILLWVQGAFVVAAGAVRFLCCCGFAAVGPTSAEYHPHKP